MCVFSAELPYHSLDYDTYETLLMKYSLSEVIFNSSRHANKSYDTAHQSHFRHSNRIDRLTAVHFNTNVCNERQRLILKIGDDRHYLRIIYFLN